MACALFKPVAAFAFPASPLLDIKTAKQKATHYLYQHFPASEQSRTMPALQIYLDYAKKNAAGLTLVKFKQSYQGLAVYQKQASVLLKADNSLATIRSNLIYGEPSKPFLRGGAQRASITSAVRLGFKSLGVKADIVIPDQSKPYEAYISNHSGQAQFESRKVVLSPIWYDLNQQLIPAFGFSLVFKDTVTGQRYNRAFIVSDGLERVSNARIVEQSNRSFHAAGDFTVIGR